MIHIPIYETVKVVDLPSEYMNRNRKETEKGIENV